MRDDFCIFILTHGRPDNVKTYAALRRCGYTGKIYLVIDNEDKTAQQYYDKYGDEVLMFNKAAMAERFDEADNFDDRRSIVYARNASFDLAEQVGCRYFMQCDDDYMEFRYCVDRNLNYVTRLKIRRFDELISLMLDYFISCQRLSTLCMAQGGDFIGGEDQVIRGIRTKRKVMNSFICDVNRRFWFNGRINEDVNTYTTEAAKGRLFLTTMQVRLKQVTTQAGDGGMTDIYLDKGTYVKTFYSVIFMPSAVKVGQLGDPRSPNYRIHHDLNWNRIAPKILREHHRKPRRD